MTETPLVTIGIPTYNRADGYLRHALQSALDQSYGNLEIIVSDNCSDDHTSEVVNAFSDNRIKYKRHETNIGANNNFNYCAEHANGRYFLLLHDDDLIDHDFVQTCIEKSQHNPEVGIIRTGTRIIDDQGQTVTQYENGVVGKSPVEQIHAWFDGKTSFYLCSTMFNTAHLQSIGGFQSPRNLFQDVVAEIMLLARYGSEDVQEVKASFRVHAGELTHAAGVDNWCDDSRFLIDVILQELPDHADELREPARRFMTKINYNRADSLKSKFQRLRAYRRVYQNFDKTLSPFNHVSKRLRKRFLASA